MITELGLRVMGFLRGARPLVPALEAAVVDERFIHLREYIDDIANDAFTSLAAANKALHDRVAELEMQVERQGEDLSGDFYRIVVTRQDEAEKRIAALEDRLSPPSVAAGS